MLINKNMKMADVIHLDHHLLHIINRFGIHLGFGDQTVAEVCNNYQLNLDFFLEIVNTYHDPTYFPVGHLQNFSAGLIIDYLRKTHQFYLEVKIPEIEELINKLVEEVSYEAQHIELLKSFFENYKLELTDHISKEELRVYPYAYKLENKLRGTNYSYEEATIPEGYTILHYEEDHDDVEAKLFDLKNIIIKYLPSPTENRRLNQILHELFELEKDLNNHGHIEDLILIPIVEKMEQELASHTDELSG